VGFEVSHSSPNKTPACKEKTVLKTNIETTVASFFISYACRLGGVARYQIDL
jgi:hypothetical protein